MNSYLVNFPMYWNSRLEEMSDRQLNRLVWDKFVSSDDPMRLLFINGLDSIRPESVFQGDIGNCQMISIIASLSRTGYGQRMIFNYFEFQNSFEVNVRLPGIENAIVVNLKDDLNMSYSSTKGEGLWLNVLEKAVAKHTLEWGHEELSCAYNRSGLIKKFALWYHLGDYRMLQTINGGTVINWFTGSALSVYSLMEEDELSSRERLSDILTNHEIVFSGILQESATQHLYLDIRRGHAYSILEFDELRDMIILRDPNGIIEIQDVQTKEPIDGKKDGVFTLPFDDFKELFEIVIFSKKKRKLTG